MRERPAGMALVLLAALGFAVAGCAVEHKAASGPITVSGVTTLSKVGIGTPIACKGGQPRVEVPQGNATVRVNMGGVSSASPATHLRLKRSLNGTVTVSCTRN